MRRIALLLASASPLLLAVSSPDGAFAERVLAAHNRERAAAGVAPLEWSARLVDQAAAHARRLSRIGGLAHLVDGPADDGTVGENLWAGTRDRYGVEQMVGHWTAERRHFRNGRFPDNSTTGRLEDVGHYTQIMWRSTARVGCAVADDGRDDYLVCRYDEGGNVIGERPY